MLGSLIRRRCSGPRSPASTAARSCAMTAATAASILRLESLCSVASRAPRLSCWGAYLAGRPHGPKDLVFTTPLGGPLRESRWVPGSFKPAARARPAGDAAVLRPLAHGREATDREGASVKAVRKQLGHATASSTLDTYGHLIPRRAGCARRAPRGPPRPGAGGAAGRRGGPTLARRRRARRTRRSVARKARAGGGARTQSHAASPSEVVTVDGL